MRFSTTLITAAALALGNTVAAYEVGTTAIDAREYNNDIEARDDYGTLQTRDFGELDARELNEIMEVAARLVEDYEHSTRDVESDHQLYTRQKGKGAQPKRAGGGAKGGKGGGGNTRVNIDPGSILGGAGHLVNALNAPRDVESDHQFYTRQKGKGAQPKRAGGGAKGGKGGGGGNTRVNIDPGSILGGAGHLVNALNAPRDVEHQLYTRQKGKGAQPKRAGGGAKGGKGGGGGNTRVNIDPGSILGGAGHLVNALNAPRDVEHQLYTRQKGKGAQPKRAGGGAKGGKGGGGNTRVNIDPGSILGGAGHLVNALHGGA